jgi:hypothetical protein
LVLPYASKTEEEEDKEENEDTPITVEEEKRSRRLTDSVTCEEEPILPLINFGEE